MSENATPLSDKFERDHPYVVGQSQEARRFYRSLERKLSTANARIAELEKDAARAQMRIDAFMRQQPIYDSALACAATVATALKKQGYRLCDCGVAPQGMCCCATTVTGPKP